MKDESCNIVVEDTVVKEVWRRHMERLMNFENIWDGNVKCEVEEGLRCLLSPNEFEEALKQCSQGKAAAPSGVVVELMAASGRLGMEWMTVLGNSILDEDRIPSDWSLSALVPLFKGKGDPLVCGSYRAIKLLEHAMKDEGI